MFLTQTASLSHGIPPEEKPPHKLTSVQYRFCLAIFSTECVASSLEGRVFSGYPLICSCHERCAFQRQPLEMVQPRILLVRVDAPVPFWRMPTDGQHSSRHGCDEERGTKNKVLSTRFGLYNDASLIKKTDEKIVVQMC